MNNSKTDLIFTNLEKSLLDEELNMVAKMSTKDLTSLATNLISIERHK